MVTQKFKKNFVQPNKVRKQGRLYSADYRLIVNLVNLRWTVENAGD